MFYIAVNGEYAFLQPSSISGYLGHTNQPALVLLLCSRAGFTDTYDVISYIRDCSGVLLQTPSKSYISCMDQLCLSGVFFSSLEEIQMRQLLG